MPAVTLATAEQAQRLAAMPELAGNGHHVPTDGATVTLNGPALDVLIDLDENHDGHCDGKAVWIGGTGYPITAAPGDPLCFEVEWADGPGSGRSSAEYAREDALRRLHNVEHPRRTYIPGYPAEIAVHVLLEMPNGGYLSQGRYTADEFRASTWGA